MIFWCLYRFSQRPTFLINQGWCKVWKSEWTSSNVSCHRCQAATSVLPPPTPLSLHHLNFKLKTPWPWIPDTVADRGGVKFHATAKRLWHLMVIQFAFTRDLSIPQKVIPPFKPRHLRILIKSLISSCQFLHSSFNRIDFIKTLI